jgi:sugar lactone lactonase YvrE
VDIVAVTASGGDLVESLFWDPIGHRLYWIDAWRASVSSLDPRTGTQTHTEFGSQMGALPIGSIARHSAGGLVSGVRGGFYHLSPADGSARLIAAVERDRPASNRLNDGKCDRAGRFWCASANTDHRTPSGALWRLTASHPPGLMQDGLIVGNGISWSPDDKFMYLADTFAGTVWRYDFDLATGEIANQHIFITSEDMQGNVDGAAVDADGCYWAALFRGTAVAQFDPDGRLMRRIDLPVSDPTICAFGGPNMDVLYVASASRFLSEAQRREQPLAGRILAIYGLDARGLPEPAFAA